MKKIYLLGPEQMMKDNSYGFVKEDGEGFASFETGSPEEVETVVKDLEKLLSEHNDHCKEEFKIVRLGEDDMTKGELLKRNLEWDMKEIEKRMKETDEEEEVRLAISKLDPDVFNKIKIKVNYDSTRHGDFSVNFHKITTEISKILNKKVSVGKVTEVFYKLLTQ